MLNKHLRVTHRPTGQVLVDWLECGPISVDIVKFGERAFAVRRIFGIEIESYLLTHDEAAEIQYAPGCGLVLLLLILSVTACGLCYGFNLSF